MGRNFAVGSPPHYRDVLVTNAVSAVRNSFPAAQALTTSHRVWLAQPAEQTGWRAVAVAAAALAQQTVSR